MDGKRTERAVSDQKADVIIEEEVIDAISQMIHRTPKKECGGFLIGNAAQDSITGTWHVHIRKFYWEERAGTDSSFQFTAEYAVNAFLHVKRCCPGSHIIGNVHSHAQFQAFWSAVDFEMMRQERSNSVYLVVSPRYGTWEAVFKDMDFKLHACDVRIAGAEAGACMFNRSLTRKDREYQEGGQLVQEAVFRAERHYTETQRNEFDKRFLHSVQELKGKKILIAGAGNIGNLLTEYAVNSGVSDITIVDKDIYQYWNLPRSSMVGEAAVQRPKAIELAKAAARKSSFSVEVRGINADICNLGWGFLKQFDLVLSPVDSAAVRQYMDRGCRLYHIPHITCGTSVINEDFTGNVIFLPADSAVDLEYIWGNGYREALEKRRSCSDLPKETQAQVMSFSAQIAGITMDLALKVLLGKCEDTVTAWKYVQNSVGNGFLRDKGALRTYKYGRLPEGQGGEFYRALAEAGEIRRIEFDRSRPKRELWEKLEELFREKTASYRLNLEWSLNLPVAYATDGAYAKIEVPENCGTDPVLMKLPREHIYLVEGDRKDYLVELCFTDK